MFFLLSLACSITDPPPDPIDPSLAATWVSDALEESRLNLDKDPDRALEAFTRALATFDERVEPMLRSQDDPRKVAALEYRFALARQAIDSHDAEAGHRLLDLGQRVREAVPAAEPPSQPDELSAVAPQ